MVRLNTPIIDKEITSITDFLPKVQEGRGHEVVMHVLQGDNITVPLLYKYLQREADISSTFFTNTSINPKTPARIVGGDVGNMPLQLLPALQNGTPQVSCVFLYGQNRNDILEVLEQRVSLNHQAELTVRGFIQGWIAEYVIATHSINSGSSVHLPDFALVHRAKILSPQKLVLSLLHELRRDSQDSAIS